MAKYRSYDAVKMVQAWLETARDAGVFWFDGTLKKSEESDAKDIDSYDGRWGEKTEAAYQAWLNYEREGADIDTMVAYGILTTEQASTVKQARAEYKAGGIREEEKPPIHYTVPPRSMVQKAGISPWVVGGFFVAGFVTALAILAIRRQG